MAERFSVGSLAISVVPSLDGFTDAMRARILPEADALGGEIGDVLAAKINEKLKDISLRVGVEDGTAGAQLEKLKLERDDLNDKKANIKVDVNNDNGAGVRSWLVSLIAGAVAIAPAFVVAGVGIAAFGAFAAPVLSGVNKYLTEMATGSAKAGAQWNSLTADQKNMAVELIALKSEFHNLSFSMQPEILQVFGVALEDINRLLPEILPVAKAAGGAIASMLTILGNGLTDSQAQEFFQFVAKNIGPDLNEISVVVVQLLHTIFSLTEAMQPLSLGLLHVVGGLADLLAMLSRDAPVLDDILILSIALYKPLQALAALKIATAFSFITDAAAGLLTFASAATAAAAQSTLLALSEDPVIAAFVAQTGAGAALDAVISEMTASEIALATASAALEAASPWLWPLVATAGLITLIVISKQAQDSTDNLVASFVKADNATGFNIDGYQKLARQIGETTNAINQNVAAGRVGDQALGGPALGHALIERQQLTLAQQEAVTAGNNLNTNLEELQAKYGLTRTQAEQLASTQKGVVSAFRDGGSAAAGMQAKIAAYVETQRLALPPASEMRTDLQGIENAAIGATNQVKFLTDAFKNLIDPTLTAEGNVVAMKNDLVTLQTALVKSKGAIGDHTQAQRDSFGAFSTYIKDIQATETSTLSATGAQRAHDLLVLHETIPGLEALAGRNSSLKGIIDALIKTIEAIPKSENTKISVLGDGHWQVDQVTGGISIPGGGGRRLTAEGWYVSGGIPGVDSVPILAQRDELIVPVPIVKSGAVDHLRGFIPGFGSGGVAGSYSGTPQGVGSFATKEYGSTVSAISASVADAIHGAITQLSSLPGRDLSAHGGSAAANQALARTLLPLFGWSVAAQFPYLLALWNRESGWNQYALNASSGATGIPQALPGDKMASAGPDWRTNPATQERWGLGYIGQRYGSPFAAWQHELSAGWYDNGGWIPPGVSTIINGSGSPEPVLSDSQWSMLQSVTQGGDGGGGTSYTANFTMPDSVFESRVRGAFRAMDMTSSLRERVGRRS